MVYDDTCILSDDISLEPFLCIYWMGVPRLWSFSGVIKTHHGIEAVSLQNETFFATCAFEMIEI